MTKLEIKSHSGKPIRSFEDWEKHALPPDRKKLHWEEGRSACELGRIWTISGEPSVPVELTRLLESNEETRNIVILSGITERETRLPFATGGPRCHDLALRAEQNGSLVTICIEAKADEPFGGTVAMELKKANEQLERRKKEQREKQNQGQKVRQPKTKFPNRLDWLTRSLLGLPAFDDDKLTKLSDSVAEVPYQLLSAIAGTLLEAEYWKAYKAVFVIHEFRTRRTEDVNLAANASALNHFLQLMLSANRAESMELEVGRMMGPIHIQERAVGGSVVLPYRIPLFVGKIRTDLRS